MTKEEAVKAVIDRGFYNPYDVFHHEPIVEKEPEGSKYEYKVSIHKWNTNSSKVTIVGVRWDEKKGRAVVSTYKQGSIKRTPHGESMRSRYTKL